MLVTPRFALTAAHCARSISNVLIFHPDRPDLARRVEIAQIVQHPEYQGELSFSTASADLAVVELANDVPASVALPIPLGFDLKPDLAHAIYGFTNPGNPPLLGHAACKVKPISPEVLGSDCTVQPGMSGSPLLVRAEAEWRVVGIVVASMPSAPGGLRAIIAEIDENLIRGSGVDIVE